MYEWRYAHYPRNYPYVGTPMAQVMFAVAEAADLIYFFAYRNVARREKMKSS